MSTKAKTLKMTVMECPECQGKGKDVRGGADLVIEMDCLFCLGFGRLTRVQAEELAEGYRKDIASANEDLAYARKRLAAIQKALS